MSGPSFGAHLRAHPRAEDGIVLGSSAKTFHSASRIMFDDGWLTANSLIKFQCSGFDCFVPTRKLLGNMEAKNQKWLASMID
jgi:hypothetical protein